MDFYCCLGSGLFNMPLFLLQGPAQAQNLRDSLAEAKSNIVVKVSSSLVGLIYLSSDTRGYLSIHTKTTLT